jgi:predicted DNA-binding WGR domain protein
MCEYISNMSSNLTKNIENIVEAVVEQFKQSILAKYEDIELKELNALWVTACKDIPTSSKDKKCTKKDDDDDDDEGDNDNTAKTCPYKMIKGPRSGKMCDAKSRSGGTHCSAHKKFETDDEPSSPKEKEKDKKVLPEAKKSVKDSTKKSKSPEKPTKILFRMHKILNVLWHEESTLVMESSENRRMALGKVVKNKVVPLTAEDYDLCKKYGFSYTDKTGKICNMKLETIKENKDDASSGDEPELSDVEDNKSSATSAKNAKDKKVDSDIDDEENSDNEDEENTPSSKSSKDVEKKIYLLADSSSAEGKKFWKGEVKGTTYTVTHGKLGTAGKVKTDNLDTNEEAVAKFDKNVKEKTKKGYSEAKEGSKNSKIIKDKEDEDDDDIEDDIKEVSKKDSKELGKALVSKALGLDIKKKDNKKKDEDDEEELLDEESD